MGLIQFVQNFDDLSTDKGYQFKFHCDKCGNGYMTHFRASTLGMAESVLQIAGHVFGGIFDAASNSAYEVQRAVGGSAHDAALAEAVREGKEYFHQCTRCGKWVCPEVCWNAQAGLCEACAPKFQEELAASHARAKVDAAREQLQEEARATKYVADVDMAASSVTAAHAPVVRSDEGACAGCGATLTASARFCADCGTPRAPAGCPACGLPVADHAKFCDQCGAKITAR